MVRKISNYLDCKNISTAISRAQKMLIAKGKRKGLYENFGQEEVRNIENKFINISSYSKEMNDNRKKLESFYNWCTSYTG